MTLVKRIALLLFCLTGTAVLAQPTLNNFLGTSSVMEDQSVRIGERMQSFIATLDNHGCADRNLLQRAFRKVHSTFLKKYQAYADFDELFSEGKYDCLTATTLFSYVLDELNFDYEIVETNYHIFMIVHTTGGIVLLETTDRLSGFVTDPASIAARTGEYKRNSVAADNSRQFFYAYSFSLYQEVSTDKLIGLLYFNQAIKAYNAHEWLACARSLEKAHTVYASARCEELGDILFKTIMEPVVSEEIKLNCLAHLKGIWPNTARTLASN